MVLSLNQYSLYLVLKQSYRIISDVGQFPRLLDFFQNFHILIYTAIFFPMKKILLFLLLLPFITALWVPGATSLVNDGAEDATQQAIRAQTLEDVESFSCEDVTDVPESECEALVDLYLSTNGAGWNNQQECSGDEYDDCWLVTTDIDQWFGITVTDRHVSIIELYGNNLVGDIPMTISDLPYLIELCLTSNLVSGVIPESISSITTLEKLSLDSNNLSGSIPESLSLLPNLSKISLGNNQISGTIPNTIGNLLTLQRLEIHNNDISGELPESLGQLTSLLILIIRDNPIEGKIPLSFTNLTNLDYFYFYGTELCEPTTPEFLTWKTSVVEWSGTDLVCMDYHHYLPIICR